MSVFLPAIFAEKMVLALIQFYRRVDPEVLIFFEVGVLGRRQRLRRSAQSCKSRFCLFCMLQTLSQQVWCRDDHEDLSQIIRMHIYCAAGQDQSNHIYIKDLLRLFNDFGAFHRKIGQMQSWTEHSDAK